MPKKKTGFNDSMIMLLNNFELSINILQNAMLSFPNEKKILMELAISYLRSNDEFSTPERRTDVKKLIDQAEQANYSSGLYWLVKALYEKANKNIDNEQAIVLIERNRQIEPDNVELLTILGTLHTICRRMRSLHLIIKMGYLGLP